MDLSDIGEIVQSEWFKTFEMRPDMNLWMGEYVVMPNHFHAIIGIGENEHNTQRNTQRYTTDTTNTTEIKNVQTHYKASPKHQFDTQSKNLTTIIRNSKCGIIKTTLKFNPK